MKSRAYTAIINHGAVAGGLGNVAWNVDNFNRSCLLKSIIFDIQIHEAVSNTVLPLDQNTTQEFSLSVSRVPIPSVYSEVFTNFSILGAVADNGGVIRMFRPRQIILNNFWMVNNLYISLNYANRDVLLEYHYAASVLLEIEDIDVL